ncbi:hypothetical protein AQUCO_01000547v1 [Aquilegia coerulea]|uniref:Uncharacterized protein n=1 Tax=Aquilegia coerulea TaxID=218851 RepID=A0A2G5EB06_AQUCA|nr:hypothetical protein AQUCO_01000547v1 [Aquilegia coerulea]
MVPCTCKKQITVNLSETDDTKISGVLESALINLQLLSYNMDIMNEGVGERSYAENSSYQKSVLSKAKPFVEETIVQLYSKTFPQCLTIADLGCCSGPNSLFIISEILKAINAVCQKLGRSPPEFQVFLNDLPANDFNTVFKSTPHFYEKFRSDNGQKFGPIFVAGVPGSFYNRLFPTKALNFVHSSYALHWLSQVPQGIENNKGNVYLARTSPSNVYKAYSEQFNKDFSVFLSTRSKEMMVGGCMVITIVGRRSSDPPSKDYRYFWEVFSKTLRDMVSEVC